MSSVPNHEIVIERRLDDRLAVVNFRSEHRLNPITRSLVTELRDALAGLRDEDPAVVALRGGVSFSCGAHIGELGALSPAELDAFVADELELFEEVRQFPALMVAVITGNCVGNGAELALACDLRIASNDVVMSWPEVLIGQPGPVEQLTALVGQAHAANLALTGRPLPAADAMRLGILAEVYDHSEFERSSRAWLEGAAGLDREAIRATRSRLRPSRR